MNEFEKNKWQIAENEHETDITDMELLLWQTFHGFQRWQEGCELAVNSNALSGNELFILHMVRMNDHPKTVQNIAHLLNQDDTHNIAYSINKLLRMGFLERICGASKTATYQITEKGIKNTNNFVKARKEILVSLFRKAPRPELKTLFKELSKIMALYDEAARTMAPYKTNSN